MIEYNEVSRVFICKNLWLKKIFENHFVISGNKLYKLSYNLKKARFLGKNTLLSFGGAFSNHLDALSAAGDTYGFETIGIIRGEELIDKIGENPTLNRAQKRGMHLEFVSREEYKKRDDETYVEELKSKFGDFYLIPEGGTNELAVKGCEEMLAAADEDYDLICCPVGTGGSIAGIINASRPQQRVLGFSALKGDFLKDNISKFAKKDNWELITDYTFGGYAKINCELISFINDFKKKYDIPLDPIYTGKVMYGIMDMMEKGEIDGDTKVLAIHTGGLQGIEGMNIKLKKKGLPQIDI